MFIDFLFKIEKRNRENPSHLGKEVCNITTEVFIYLFFAFNPQKSIKHT